MTNEEFEKKMEFIIEHQARFAVDIQQLQEAQARTERTVAQTEQIVGRLANVTSEGFKDLKARIDALVDSHIRLADSHTRLTESQARTEENLRNVNAKIDALVDSQIHTDENLRNLTGKVDALVSVIDRYFREGRNGESGQ